MAKTVCQPALFELLLLFYSLYLYKNSLTDKRPAKVQIVVINDTGGD